MLGRARMKRIYVRACLHTNSARDDPVNIVRAQKVSFKFLPIENSIIIIILSQCHVFWNHVKN